MSNLFAIESKTELKRFVSEDWAEELSNYITLESFNKIKNDVRLQRLQGIVYPESKDVFKALSYPLDKVKVVIVGQDPYYNGNADGLAFSCKNSLSPSLKQILQAIWYDECKEINLPQNLVTMNQYIANKNNWNLNYLVEQGVFLYNPTLTVNQGNANSHKGIWTAFTKAVFNALTTKENLVFILWGKEAQDAFYKLPLTIKDNLFCLCEHPASASFQQRIWNCNHFTACNEWLKSRNLTEIEWIQR